MNLRAAGRVAPIVGVLAALVVAQAIAVPSLSKKTGAACAACHTNVAGGAGLTDAGKAYKADETKVPEKGTPNEFIGANKCKTCHSKQNKAWLESKHAKSLEALAKADEKTAADWATKMGITLTGKPAETEACVACHVTGHKLPGGFPAADSTLNANVSFVGCEACHGPGAAHKAAAKEEKAKFTNNAVGETLCKSCHTDKSSPKFKYADMKGKVHPVPAAE